MKQQGSAVQLHAKQGGRFKVAINFLRPGPHCRIYQRCIMNRLFILTAAIALMAGCAGPGGPTGGTAGTGTSFNDPSSVYFGG